jgi:hypothetical protein
MRQLIITAILIIPLACSIFGQKADSLSISMDVRRRKIERKAMSVLGTWSTLQIVSGLGLGLTQQGTSREFFRMNALWNVVNASLVLGSVQTQKKEIWSSDPVLALHRYEKLERTLLFNCGLDLAYITAGYAINMQAKTATNAQTRNILNGWGNSLYLQGGFLLVFDALFYHSLHKASNQYRSYLQSIWLNHSGAGLNLRF